MRGDFPECHKQLGHEDIEEFPLFGELVDLFGVPRLVWAIEAFKPLPDLGHGLIASPPSQPALIGAPNATGIGAPSEWNFLLNDLEQYLAPKGQIFFH